MLNMCYRYYFGNEIKYNNIWSMAIVRFILKTVYLHNFMDAKWIQEDCFDLHFSHVVWGPGVIVDISSNNPLIQHIKHQRWTGSKGRNVMSHPEWNFPPILSIACPVQSVRDPGSTELKAGDPPGAASQSTTRRTRTIFYLGKQTVGPLLHPDYFALTDGKEIFFRSVWQSTLLDLWTQCQHFLCNGSWEGPTNYRKYLTLQPTEGSYHAEYY